MRKRIIAVVGLIATAGPALVFGGIKWMWRLGRWGLDALGVITAPEDAEKARRMLENNPDWPVIAGISLGLICLWLAIRPRASATSSPPEADWAAHELFTHLDSVIGWENAETAFKDAAANEQLKVWGRAFDEMGHFVGEKAALHLVPHTYWPKASIDANAHIGDDESRYGRPHTRPAFHVKSISPVYCDLMVSKKEALALWPRRKRKATEEERPRIVVQTEPDPISGPIEGVETVTLREAGVRLYDGLKDGEGTLKETINGFAEHEDRNYIRHAIDLMLTMAKDHNLRLYGVRQSGLSYERLKDDDLRLNVLANCESLGERTYATGTLVETTVYHDVLIASEDVDAFIKEYNEA